MTLSNQETPSQNSDKFLSAAESDPVKMGWMQGFPPPPDKIIKAGDGSFFKFPAMRYSVAHMEQFLPTTNVSRGLKTAVPFEYKLDRKINSLEFTPLNSTKPMTWETSLSENYTDGIIILHRGKVIYEQYFGALDEKGKHAAMSVTKSFTGTLASILVAEGKLDETKKVTFYVPELKNSAYADATVRQVMDMTTGLKYSEDYADPNAEIWEYSAAGNPLPKPKDYKGPVGYFQYLETVKKQGEHGEIFGYKTVNADALGWIISRASGKSVSDLLSEKIWSQLGMEQDAYYQVDELGIAFAGGGLSTGLRDMARFGETLRNKGKWQGKQILPSKAVEDIEKGGSKEAFEKSDHPELKGWSYRDMWWITHNKNGAYAARGVHGQTIYIDPKAEMVIVRFASHPIAGNSANDPTSLPAYAAVADYLIRKK
ncbi:MAG: serine hydrolase [Acidobacteriota bacterium]